jgi:hypothetical protein
MRADTHTIQKLFKQDVQYVIPEFQRPYVWGEEEQWDPLWQDLTAAADRYLEHLLQLRASAHATPEQQAEERAGRHFLGAVVLKQKPTPTASIEIREVIDGQQRMTTFLLVTHAAASALAELGHEAARVKRLVWNRDSDGDERFKVWPTRSDRDAFRAVMEEDRSVPDLGRIGEAHDFFRYRMLDWVGGGPDDPMACDRAHAFETALMGLMQAVVIDLEPADDPFVIFETLNARGTPLLESDLVKNLVMQVGSGRGLQPSDLSKRFWSRFDTAWWRKEIRQGRITRPRIDTFLDYWLELRLREEVSSHMVFHRFRDYLSDRGHDVTAVLEDLCEGGEAWRELDDIEPGTPEERFVYRWRTVEAGPLTPLVVHLNSLRRRGALETEGFLAAAATIESYLIRRMICRMTAKDYNRLFLEALNHVLDVPPSEIVPTLTAYLANQTADAREWPRDRAVEHAVLESPLYRLLTRGRMRLILEGIEDSLRSSRSEDQRVARNLTIEHVMPQKWERNWPAPADGEEHAVEDRDRLIHTLGNLTLVTKSMNPALSNAAWADKRTALHKHSNLLMTRRLLDEAGSNWSEDTIRDRGQKLAKMVCQVWPRPDPGA